MTITDSPPPARPAASEFVSLAALHAAHGALLRRHREAGTTEGLLRDIEEFVRRGQATGAVLDAEADRSAAQTLLDYWDTTLYRAGRELGDPILAEFDDARSPELDDSLSPYVGLDAFREGSHDKFFGRQRLLQEWIGRLHSQQLLVVLGLSGSGKSSLVLGGLIPALKAGALPDSQHWRYYPAMVPGSDPLTSLARITRPSDASPADWIRQAADRFRHDSGHLAALVADSATPVVLVVDQFEETFTLCTDEEARQAFVDNLLSLVRAPDPRHILVLTMRSDYEPHLSLLPELQSRLEEAQARVGPLHPSELREAIEKPAARVGLQFEEGIVDDLIHEMRSEPAGLPLLQFTLLKLWEQRKRNRVTREAYAGLGGIRRALEVSADRFFDGLSTHAQDVVKRILLRMVRPDKGLEVTSSRILRESLYPNNVNREWIDDVLTRLIDARLVRETKGDTPADDQVEVAHEALVRNWGRLLEWLDEERDAIRDRSRLTAAAEQWDARGRPSDALLRGQILDEAARLKESLGADGLSRLEGLFLDESQAQRARERRQQRRAAQWRLAGLAIIALLVAAIPASFGVGQYQLIQERANLLLSRQLAAQARAALKEAQPDLALLLSVEAIRAHDGVEAQSSLLTSLAYSPDTAIVRDHATEVKGVAFSPDGRTLASVDDEGRIVLWSTTTYQPLGQPLTSTSSDGMTVVATGLAFSPDGATLAMTTDDGQIVAWCVATRTQQLNAATSCPPSPLPDSAVAQPVSLLVSRENGVITLWDPATLTHRPLDVQLADQAPGMSVFAVSPDGRLIAGGSDTGEMALWNAIDGTPYVTGRGPAPDGAAPSANRTARLSVQATSAVRSLAFSRDGLKLAWGTADGTVGVWHITRGKQLQTLNDAKAAISSLAFGPDDKLAWGSADARLYVRDVSTGPRLPFAAVISTGRASSPAVAFSADGQEIAYINAESHVTRIPAETVVAHPAQDRQPRGEARGPAATAPMPRDLIGEEPVTSLAFDAGGRLLATATRDGAIWLWDAEQPAPRPLGAQPTPATSLTFSPTGDRLASGGQDGQVVIWDVAASRSLGSPLPGNGRPVIHLAFSPDGRTLASVDDDGIRLWSLAGPEPGLRPFFDLVVAPSVRSVDFSRDGRLLATGGSDGTILIWDAQTGERRAQLRPTSATPTSNASGESPFSTSKSAVTAVAFHPNGKLLAAGTFDGGLTLWDTETGQPLAPPLKVDKAHTEPLTSLSFSPDGNALASGSADVPLVIWSLNVHVWIDDACTVARRNLTPTEWTQYLGDATPRPTCPEQTAQASADPAATAPVGRVESTGRVRPLRAAGVADGNVLAVTAGTIKAQPEHRLRHGQGGTDDGDDVDPNLALD